MELSPDARRLVEEFREGRTRALARCISLVEDERPGFEAVLDALHGRVGRARRIGITGPPGAGKSTLTAGLARRLRGEGLSVGILAVDPTSPFSGGALLGDRIRMGELASDEGVFIRSMASRGSLGGLATATREAADLVDAFGFDRVLLETVGVGQAELQVADSADTTAVVLVPESGDGVQTMKAGLMEIADVFVVNKADRTGADRLMRELRVMIDIRSSGPDPGPWEVPVLRSVATEGTGVEELADALDRHGRWLRESGRLEAHRAENRLDQARAVLLRRAARRARELWEERRAEVRRLLEEEGLSPYRAAGRVAGG